MRPSTIPSMLNVLNFNLNQKNPEAKLFDISRSYKNTGNKIENGEVPEEEKILSIGMYGENLDFYVLKGLVENILEEVSINRYEIQKEQTNKSYHPGRCANIKIGIDTIATFGEVHPEVLQNYDIEKRIYLAEINITKLTKYSRSNKKYEEIAKFPAVERDLAVIVAEEIEAGQIEKTIVKKAKKVLEEVKVFDIYRSEKLGKGKKSIAYALKFRDRNKTLNDEEIDEIMKNIITELHKNFGAELRNG